VTPFWKREKPLHEQLADEGGMTLAQTGGREVAPWDKAGIHGVPRPRRWDAVVSAEADVPGDTVHFVALEDRTLIVDEDVPDEALTPLADAVEVELSPPYRAEATRQGERLWAVGATTIRTATIAEEVAGDTVELAVQDGERTLLVDGALAFGSLPELEALAQGMRSYVVRADRLDGNVWAVEATPL
jgi:hypothetical protein